MGPGQQPLARAQAFPLGTGVHPSREIGRHAVSRHGAILRDAIYLDADGVDDRPVHLVNAHEESLAHVDGARVLRLVAQIGQIARNLEHQLNLVVDTFNLINGQLRTRPPEAMLSDVDDAISSSQSLTETLAEVAPLEQQIQRLGQSAGGG